MLYDCRRLEGENANRENGCKYKILKTLTDKFVSNDVIIMGDMNGHIGILNEQINANGEKLLRFMDETDLENLNVTMAEGKVTWKSKEHESAIDQSANRGISFAGGH